MTAHETMAQINENARVAVAGMDATTREQLIYALLSAKTMRRRWLKQTDNVSFGPVLIEIRRKEAEMERKVVNNSLGMLSGYVFDELDKLSEIDPSENPEALDAEIKRAKALGDMAKVAIENANTMLDVVKLQAQYLSGGNKVEVPKELAG